MCHTFPPPCLFFILSLVVSFTAIFPHWHPMIFLRCSSNMISAQKTFSKNTLQNFLLLCTTPALGLTTSDSTFIANSPSPLWREKKMCSSDEDKLQRGVQKTALRFWLGHQQWTRYKSNRVLWMVRKLSCVFRSVLLRGVFIKAITRNFCVASHFYNNKYNPVSRRVEPKFKAINSFPRSIILHRF